MNEDVYYLGDSVYARINEVGQLVLFTHNGLPTDPSNTITFEPEVFSALLRFVQSKGF